MKPRADGLTRSVCPYCGVGCGVLIETQAGKITNVAGDPAHPANRGRLCSKGSTLHLTTSATTRVLQPELRRNRQTTRQSASWDDALDLIADRFAETIATYGPDSVAFYISGQLLTEEYYVFNKLAKGLIGTNNVDTNSRLCMSSAVAAYKATLGADAPPACYDDIELADVILIAGANPAYAHPILYRRLEAARAANPKLKVIVIDPRRTVTAEEADLHLPVLPGTDVALFNGLLHLLLWEDKLDYDYIAAHTDGFHVLKNILHDYHPRHVAEICGISEESLRAAARLIGGAAGLLSLYCQGLNQSTHGTANNAALINLHLATGQIGRPGAGPFSLTGQPNAMGGREVGGMANLLSAHRDLANPAHRAEVAALWGVPQVPSTPGKTAIEMFKALHDGTIKCIWIACTNPAQSLPNQTLVRAALEAAEFVVLQEAFGDTETARYADVLLPAASWGEKDGTMTNSERRVARVRAAVAPPGSARPDAEIVIDCARRLAERLGRATPALFPYQGIEEIFNEHRATTAGRDLDITGLSYASLDAHGPQQWPRRAGDDAESARLYADGYFATASGRAHFYPAHYSPVSEAPDARFPFTLNTGRLRDQWHGMSRTGQVARLFAHAEEPCLTMHADDMARRQLVEGALVSVRSRRGQVWLKVEAGASVRVGQVFIPMHWGSQWWNGHGVNDLTVDDYDATSKQPELKACAVAIEKAELPWRLIAMAVSAPHQAEHAYRQLQALRATLGSFDYASVGRFGRAREGITLRVAHRGAPDPAVLETILVALGLTPGPAVMSYVDPRLQISRCVRVEDERIVALVLAGNIVGHEWLEAWLDNGHSIASVGASILAPRAEPPEATAPMSPVVCSCVNVSRREIETCLESNVAEVDAFGVLQRQLKCATECGSCGPEIRRMIVAHTSVAA